VSARGPARATPAFRRAAWLIGLALAAPAPLRAEDRGGPTYGLVVEVTYGEPRGPEGLRDELQFEITSALAAAGRFRAVRARPDPAPAADELLLRVVLDGYEEEIVFDASIAERTSPGAPPDVAQRLEARIRADLRLEVRTLPDTALVRHKTVRVQGARRPALDEDPRHEAELELVSEAVRAVRSFAGRGSPARWSAEIERARAGSAGPAPAPPPR
jgi:hypothetical protein